MSRKILLILFTAFVVIPLIQHITSVRAETGDKVSETLKSEAIVLANKALEKGEIGPNAEIQIITDEKEIREELEKAGLDPDKLLADMEENPPGSKGLGGHAGVFIPPCGGPSTANDLFLVSPGPFGSMFFDVSWKEIGVCVGSGICTAFPACLVNAVCHIPTGQVAAAYGVAGGYTTDLGAGCSP